MLYVPNVFLREGSQFRLKPQLRGLKVARDRFYLLLTIYVTWLARDASQLDFPLQKVCLSLDQAFVGRHERQ